MREERGEAVKTTVKKLSSQTCLTSPRNKDQLPAWADPAFIAANAPSRRTRSGISRSQAESRGSAMRTRRASISRKPALGSAVRRSTSLATGVVAALPAGEVRKVIVIGAGYAGISAARTLADFGYTVRPQRACISVRHSFPTLLPPGLVRMKCAGASGRGARAYRRARALGAVPARRARRHC